MNRNTNISPEEYEIIERYLLNEMPEDDYDAFTKRISNDIELQDKVNAVRLMLVGIQESALTEKTEDFHKELFSSEKKINQSRGKILSMKRWIVAASVIVLVGLGAILFFTKSNKQERLFAEYYKPDPGLITAMGTSDNYLFDHAMIDYKTKKYDSAINTWKKLLVTKPANDTLNYFIGLAFLAKENTDSAIIYLLKVVPDPQSYFFSDANWYLGLAAVKQQKRQKAILYIERSKHPGKATLLMKLKK